MHGQGCLFLGSLAVASAFPAEGHEIARAGARIIQLDDSFTSPFGGVRVPTARQQHRVQQQMTGIFRRALGSCQELAQLGVALFVDELGSESGVQGRTRCDHRR